MIPLLLISFVKAEILNVPKWESLNMKDVKYDPQKNVFVDYHESWDTWMFSLTLEQRKKLMAPMEIPAKKKVTLSLRENLFTDDKQTFASSAFAASFVKKEKKRRFVLINVEETILDKTKESDRQYRSWPHLGLLFVGTAAHEENWEVVLWDELVQGYVNLEKLVQPGDIVGFSMVVTGIERGVVLAHKAKELGARYCIAGNDSATFRVNQILSMEDKPIDAVFTTNSVMAVKSFFRQINDVPIEALSIRGVETKSETSQRSNQRECLVAEQDERKKLHGQGKFDSEDVFIVPKLDLYPESYWREVWGNYQNQFGHKHPNPTTVKNALALFAQGCTRTQGHDVCSYCTIGGVADIRIPSRDYIIKSAQAYKDFGIDMVFNVTDSSFEMTPVLNTLIEEDIRFNAMIIYGRAQGLTKMPQQIEKWLTRVRDRLLINVGMDSGDETILKSGVGKSSVTAGSRVYENRCAVENIKKTGAHLHYSLIFGSPGETRESCERSIESLQWSIQTLGTQLDVCETDIYWLNFGSPASRVFQDYMYAVYLSSLANKFITPEEWQRNFHAFRNYLVTPLEVEKAWYHYFTNIDLDTAQEYNKRCTDLMEKHTGSIRGRAFKPSLNS